MPPPDRFVVDGFRGIRGGPVAVELVDGVLRPTEEPPSGPRLSGTLLPGVVDHHVHLGLIDGARFAASPVVEVHDLGWIPEVARGWRRSPHTGGSIRIAGPILTAPGGYPLGHWWAPDAMVRQLADPDDARVAVAEGVAHGHDLVKVALHAGQGRFDDVTLAALVEAAHAAGQQVGVHAEGPGQPERALEVGADLLVHVPWTEALAEPLIGAMVERTAWISTLAVHGGRARRNAARNARAFLTAGGRIRYGTDLGNGPTPPGLSLPEVAALADLGMAPESLLDVLVGPPTREIPLERALLVPGRTPGRASSIGPWLAGARRFGSVVAG